MGAGGAAATPAAAAGTRGSATRAAATTTRAGTTATGGTTARAATTATAGATVTGVGTATAAATGTAGLPRTRPFARSRPRITHSPVRRPPGAGQNKGCQGRQPSAERGRGPLRPRARPLTTWARGGTLPRALSFAPGGAKVPQYRMK